VHLVSDRSHGAVDSKPLKHGDDLLQR
jgi:hypothetical protein